MVTGGSTTRCANRGKAGTSRSANAAATRFQSSGSSNQKTTGLARRACG
jgi:hypothetical protein